MSIEYRSAKTYGHDTGLSCSFRNWRATSHCRLMHGYALKVRIEFAAIHLDDRSWVMDFGGLKQFKERLQSNFDHKVLVATDDPEIHWYREGFRRCIIDLVEVPAIGCEAFAAAILAMANVWLSQQLDIRERVRVTEVEVSEHDGNSAKVIQP